MQRFQFTKENLLAVHCPEERSFLEVYDLTIKELGCRISALGTMTMLIRKKVANRPVRKTLGRYVPGPGGKTVDDFRRKARAELGRIADDPDRWIEGETATEADKFTLEDAFKSALGATRRAAMGLRDWNAAKDKFLAWMKDQYPHIDTWAKLRRVHVRQYMEAQKPTPKSIERGLLVLSATRIRLLMQPITQTSRHMWLEYEIPNVAERLGLSARLSKTPAPVYLEDVLGFLGHLRDRRLASLEAGAALAGLAGLQLLEILRLTWNRVDLDHGLIEVSGEVKNIYRNRVIPIPQRCREALKRAYLARPASAVEAVDGGHVVTSISGVPFLGGSWMNYSKWLKGEILAWNAGMRHWAPKDLRNCLMTLGALQGFSGDLLEQYVGHAPRTVTARNYLPRLASASIGEATELKRQMDVFRRLVVEPIESEIKAIEARQKGKVVELGKA